MSWNIEWTITEGTTVRPHRAHVPSLGPQDDRTCFAERIAAAADAAGLVSVTATRHPTSQVAEWDDPHYQMVADDLRDGLVVPFFGAGASISVRGKSERWNFGASIPPSARELADYLSEACEYHGTSPQDCEDLGRIASRFTQKHGKRNLASTLRSIFIPANNAPAAPADRPLHTPHWLFAKAIVQIQKPMLIVTTNYDRLIEDALRREGVSEFDVVAHTDNKEYLNSVIVQSPNPKSSTLEFMEPEVIPTNTLAARVNPAKRTIIYKMHGSVYTEKKWDSFVIDEEDYVNLLARTNAQQSIIPGAISEHLEGKSCLFLGYSLRDWNFRIVLQALRLRDNETRHMAVQYYPTQTEKELWEGRHVNIYHAEILNFVEGLAGKLDIPIPSPPPNLESGEPQQSVASEFIDLVNGIAGSVAETLPSMPITDEETETVDLSSPSPGDEITGANK